MQHTKVSALTDCRFRGQMHSDFGAPGVRPASGIFQLFKRGLRIGIGNVGADRVIEQDHVLRDQAKRLPKRCLRQVTNIETIHQNPALIHIIEAEEQLQQLCSYLRRQFFHLLLG